MRHEIAAKVNVGPGGFKCRCCNRLGSAKAAKILANRINRRKAKLNLKKDF